MKNILCNSQKISHLELCFHMNLWRQFLLALMNWPSGETSAPSQVFQWYWVANKNSKSESIVEMWETWKRSMGKHTRRPCHHTAHISHWFRPAESRFHWYPTPRTFPLYQSQTYQSEDSHPYLDKLVPPTHTHTHPYKEHWGSVFHCAVYEQFVSTSECDMI